MAQATASQIILPMVGASEVAGGGAAAGLPLCPAPTSPSRHEKKILCALSTLPVHCHRVNFK